MRSQAPYNNHEVILCPFRSSPCVSIWRGIISPIIILQIRELTRKLCTASGMIDPSPLRRLAGSVRYWAASPTNSSVMRQSGRNNGQKSEALVPSNKKDSLAEENRQSAASGGKSEPKRGVYCGNVQSSHLSVTAAPCHLPSRGGFGLCKIKRLPLRGAVAAGD